MLNWLRRRSQPRWTRRTTWTPLLLSQRQLQRVLAKERQRADRERAVFGMVILRVVDLQRVRSSTIQLARILHRRLRETDEKGHLNYGRIGVVLPNTDEEGTQFVLDDILRLAAKARLGIQGEAFVYPERPSRPHYPDESNPAGVLPEKVRDKSGVSGGNGARLGPIAMSLIVQPYPAWKRALDFAGASVGLLMAAPIIALFALIIRLTSPGPAIFAQERVGYLGQRFKIYKLRSMVVNAEQLKADLIECNERDGPAFKMLRDPRITRCGRLLRATGLDELPQLFNVLRGDMSLVGPRPLPVDEAEQCEPWQKARLDTKPGLTCYWQIAKSRHMSFAEWMRLDMRYARAKNFLLDAQLILKTFTAVISGRVGH
jgi:lipopolysaccharide/colanic/teichoic acid biosynthesis glycosyltransferase